jgi:uncharacterized protein
MMKIGCPRCGKETDTENNPFRPFCSEHCKLIDLGNWISGSYGIPDDGVDGIDGNEDERDETAPVKDYDDD